MDFPPKSGPGFVYVLFWVDDSKEIPFYVGQTQAVFGRLNDYYWADFYAPTDFNVGEAVKRFSDHRIRDWEDFEIHVGHIFRNPVGRKLVERATDYPYCSAFPGSEKDEVPQWLKPGEEPVFIGTAEAVPFQNR